MNITTAYLNAHVVCGSSTTFTTYPLYPYPRRMSTIYPPPVVLNGLYCTAGRRDVPGTHRELSENPGMLLWLYCIYFSRSHLLPFDIIGNCAYGPEKTKIGPKVCRGSFPPPVPYPHPTYPVTPTRHLHSRQMHGRQNISPQPMFSHTCA